MRSPVVVDGTERALLHHRAVTQLHNAIPAKLSDFEESDGDARSEEMELDLATRLMSTHLLLERIGWSLQVVGDSHVLVDENVLAGLWPAGRIVQSWPRLLEAFLRGQLADDDEREHDARGVLQSDNPVFDEQGPGSRVSPREFARVTVDADLLPFARLCARLLEELAPWSEES